MVLAFTLLFYTIMLNSKAIDDLNSGEDWVVIVVLLVCLLLAFLLTQFLCRKTEIQHYTSNIFAALAFGALAMLILANIDLDDWIKFAIIIVAAIIGFSVARGNEARIYAYSTAFIGAVLIIAGIGHFVGDFPDLLKNGKIKFDWSYMGYIAGIVLITLIGGAA